MKYDKPFKTYEEQIEKLQKDYGLQIGSVDFAIHALSTISYYDLVNGYKDIFMVNGKYKSGINMAFLYEFHLFDKKFQNVLFRHSIFIENMFKTKLAYILAKNHGVHIDEYLHHSVFNVKRKSITFDRIKKDVFKTCINSDYVQLPTRHYLETHNHIPPWILLKNVSFANAINLFSLLKTQDKIELANEMISLSELKPREKIEFILRALNLIRDFRNRIAHNLKFAGYKTAHQNKLPKLIKELTPSYLLTVNEINYRKRGRDDVYGLIMAIVALINTPYLLSEFLNEIYYIIASNANSENRGNVLKESIVANYLKINNIPDNISKRIELALQDIICFD